MRPVLLGSVIDLIGLISALLLAAEGCLTYLRSTSPGNTRDVILALLGGLSPGPGLDPLTVMVVDGVDEEPLLRGRPISRFVRLAPGARMDGLRYTGDCEFMVVAGAFFGLFYTIGINCAFGVNATKTIHSAVLIKKRCNLPVVLGDCLSSDQK